MGHIHLGVLPRSKQWRQVVELLGSGAADEAVFAAAAIAAEKDLARAADDAVFVEAVRLLLMIPFAARGDDFGQALRDCDLPISSTPDLFEISAAAGARLDEIARAAGRRSDFGELAGRALIGTLNDQIGQSLPGLFEATDRDVQIEAQRLSRPSGVGSGMTATLCVSSCARCADRWQAMLTPSRLPAASPATGASLPHCGSPPPTRRSPRLSAHGTTRPCASTPPPASSISRPARCTATIPPAC